MRTLARERGGVLEFSRAPYDSVSVMSSDD
jgi:hypothetical protein